MKNKTFLILFLTCVCSSAIYSGEVTVKSWGAGAKIKAPVVELQYYQQEEQNNWGLTFLTDSFWQKFPCRLIAGNMNCGGIWSLMKNPEPSFSFSPFYTPKSSVQGVSGALCSSSSFPENISCFLQLGYSDSRKKLSQMNLNCWYDNQAETAAASALIQFRFTKKITLGLSTAAGLVPYGDNSFSSWFNSGAAFFHSGTMFTLGNQLSLSLPSCKFWLFTSTYQTPYGSVKTVYRSENQFKAGSFNFALSAFYNPWENLYLPDDSFLKPMLVLRTGIKHTGVVKVWEPLIIKSGINGYLKINLSENEHPLKLTAGTQLTGRNSSWNIHSLTAFSIISTEQPDSLIFTSQKIVLSCNYHLSKMTLTAAGQWTFSPESDGSAFTQKYSGGIYGGKNLKYNGTISWSQTAMNGVFTNNGFTLGFGVQTKEDWLTLSGRVNVQIDM